MSEEILLPKEYWPIPAEILDLLGKPPVLSTEDPKTYDKLFAAIARHCQPVEIMEWFYVRDLVDSLWDIQRMTIFKTEVLEISEKLIAEERAVKARQDMMIVALQERQKAGLVNDGVTLPEIPPVAPLPQPMDMARGFVRSLSIYEKIEELIDRYRVVRARSPNELLNYREAAKRRQAARPGRKHEAESVPLVPTSEGP